MLAHGVRHVWLVAVSLALLVAAQKPVAGQPASELEELLEEGVFLDFNAGLRELDIATIAIDPQRETRMYAAGVGHIYRSLDGGARWEVVHTVAQGGRAPVSADRPLSVSAIDELTDEQLERVDDRLEQLENELFEDLLDETDELTAELIVEASRADLLEQAIDDVLSDEAPSIAAAELFSPDPERIPQNRFTQIVIDPDDPSQVYAASGRGVLRSTDFGNSWETIYRGIGDQERRVVALALTVDAVVLATASGVQRAERAELRWSRPPGPPTTAESRFMAGAPSRPQRLYLVAEGRVYRSDDGGLDWLPMAIPAGFRPEEFSNIAIDPADPDHLYLGTAQGVLESADAGNSFRRLGLLGLTERRVSWISLADDAILAGTVDGLYGSTDSGMRWRELENGLSAAVIRQIAVARSNTLWLATDQGIFRLMSPTALSVSTETARELRERWAREPDLAATVTAALIHYGYVDPGVERWARRIYLSRFLPDAEVRLVWFRRARVTGDFVPSATGQPLHDGVHFRREQDDEVRFLLRWDVEPWILDIRQVQQRDTGDRIIRRRRDLIRRVVRTYASRRELMLRMASRPSATPWREASDHLGVEELTARLNVMTGWFFAPDLGTRSR